MMFKINMDATCLFFQSADVIEILFYNRRL